MPIAPHPNGRFRLRSILLVIYLLVLIAPIGSIYGFRLYENELVRQTEIELITQGAYIRAAYKQVMLPLLARRPEYGIPAQHTPQLPDEKYKVIRPALDVGSAMVHPPRPDAVNTTHRPDPLAARVGNTIFPMIGEATLTTLAGIRITDYQGIVVAGRSEIGLSLAHVEEVAEALKGQYNSRLRQRISQHEPPPLHSISRGTGIRLFVAMPILESDRVIGTVLLSRTPRTILQGLQSEQRRMILAVTVLLGITISLAWLTSSAISRPIDALVRQTQRVADGERDVQPIREPVTRELALLSQHIAQMAETIAQRSDYIRNFAMHVSHEFKTPLTSIQGAIELIHEHGDAMTPEQFSRFLGNISQDTERLNHLVNRLLELARADVEKPRAETTPSHSLLDNLQAYYGNRVKIIMPENSETLPIPQDIASTILGNLIENSLQHGATEITVTLKKALVHPLILTIHDNGSGISPANATKLFTPFFTTRRETGGTGIGLVMIRALLNAYKGTIHCHPSAKGACFIITLPA